MSNGTYQGVEREHTVLVATESFHLPYRHLDAERLICMVLEVLEHLRAVRNSRHTFDLGSGARVLMGG